MAATSSLHMDANHSFHVGCCWTSSTQCSALIQLDCNPATHPPLFLWKILKCMFFFNLSF